jgi:hypothetical protein
VCSSDLADFAATFLPSPEIGELRPIEEGEGSEEDSD